jgi:hypothetical protein
VATFIEQWRTRANGTEVRRTGEDTVLGRRVEVIEIRPAWRSSSGSDAARGPSAPPATAGAGTETSGGVVRVAIDPERMFIMRWEVDGEGGGASYRVEVVALDYGASVESSRFVFDPPPGASELPADEGSCSSSSGPFGGQQVSVPAGFLRPAYVPQGFEQTASASETGSEGCRITAASVLLERDGGGYLLLRQRLRFELPDTVLAWGPVSLDGRDGYHDFGGATRRLAWQQGEVAALLESDVLAIDELIRVANSMN